MKHRKPYNKIPVRIDDKTMILVPEGSDVEQAKERFLNRLHLSREQKEVPNHAKGYRG